MIRRPPRSTLFPTRRSSDLSAKLIDHPQIVIDKCGLPSFMQGLQKRLFRRSEEHTSELQSQSNLVCRLLLEKKKKHTEAFEANTDDVLSQIVLSPVHGLRWR